LNFVVIVPSVWIFSETLLSVCVCVCGTWQGRSIAEKWVSTFYHMQGRWKH